MPLGLQVDAYLTDKALPIWASLSAARTELYRDIRSVSCGSSPFLQRCCLCCRNMSHVYISGCACSCVRSPVYDIRAISCGSSPDHHCIP